MALPMRPLTVVVLLLALGACGEYPRDPEGTSRRVAGGVLRVGIAHDPPFVLHAGDGPRGREVALVRAFARSQGARVAWRHRGQDTLMGQLEKRQLDLVVGGHAEDSPWAARVATSRPFHVVDDHGRTVERVVALPPGENAWLLRFERYVRGPEARALLEGPAR